MRRKHYRLESDDLVRVAEEFAKQQYQAKQARLAFVDKHGAVAYCGSNMGVTGLRFEGALPAGWAPHPFLEGYGVPDVKTDLGKQILLQMHALPTAGIPKELSAQIGFVPDMKLAPGDLSRRVLCVGLERIDGEYYASVPVGNDDEVRRDPSLSYRPAMGMTEIDDNVYLALREQALQRASASRGRRPGA